MAQTTTKFIEVILPLALPNTFTYRVPRELESQVEIGKRVVVQFGFKGKKLYSGLVVEIHFNPPKEYEAKYIESVLDTEPIIHPNNQLKFWQWISDYYMCTMGEVMNAALPAGLKLSSETKVYLHPEYAENIEGLSDKEYLIMEALEIRNELVLSEIEEIISAKNIHSYIKSMIDKRVIMVEEELKQKYKPKLEDYVELTDFANSEDNLKKVFEDLEKAPKQLETLMFFLQLNKRYTEKPVPVKRLKLQKTANITASMVKELVKKNIFHVYAVEAGRLEAASADSEQKKLNPYQQKAFEEIKAQMQQKDTILLQGVTSSGKTEMYIQLIQETLKRGMQVLYLLPEIALTAQIILRLQSIFGNKVGVYHSKFNQNERVEVWRKVLDFKQDEENDYQIILGARSSIFLPFSNLGLIIVDEEHENTFKQYDPAPRYNARDTSIMLAKLHEAKVLLGSATPSIESYWNAREGKFGLVELKQRFGEMQMPEILCANVKEDSKRKKMKSHFTPLLLEKMGENLNHKKQVILFQNRRGYSPILMCNTCGYTPHCKNCDVSLTYHKYSRQLNCHYCGYGLNLPNLCPACGDHNMQVKGFGTEKIEEELAIYFPEARIARMDLDTTRKKHSYHHIISSFQDGEVDILVGTQMVAKGLDFENVALVGVLDADSMLYFPDFRAFEKSYQLMSQVAGRAGRKGKRGEVIIQTYHPDHKIVQQVIASDYEGMYNDEIAERKNFKYPPFHRLIKISLRHREIQKLNESADELAEGLQSVFGDRVLGPEFPGISRIKNLYIKNILLKIERKASIKKVKEILRTQIQEFSGEKKNRSIRINIDVDPL